MAPQYSILWLENFNSTKQMPFSLNQPHIKDNHALNCDVLFTFFNINLKPTKCFTIYSKGNKERFTYPSPSNLQNDQWRELKHIYQPLNQLKWTYVYIYLFITSYQWNPATGPNFGLEPTLTNSPFKHSWNTIKICIVTDKIPTNKNCNQNTILIKFNSWKLKYTA